MIFKELISCSMGYDPIAEIEGVSFNDFPLFPG